MYTFIVNPNARSGLGIRVWKTIEKELQKRAVRYRVFLTGYQGHATRITRKLLSGDGHVTLTVLGGDGTLNEVINGILHFDQVTLAYIPIGSSNDFARGMRLSRDPLTALDHILAPSRFTRISIGVLKYSSRSRRFIVSSGLGFDALVCHRAVISTFKRLLNKVALGKLSYVCIALQCLFFQTPGALTLELDSQHPIHFEKVYFTAFMNQKYEGGGFMFCPKANPEDDLLDLIVVEGISKLKILCLLSTAFFGRHTKFTGIHTYQCKKATVRSTRPLPVHTDGEPVFLQREVSAFLEPLKIRFIVS